MAGAWPRRGCIARQGVIFIRAQRTARPIAHLFRAAQIFYAGRGGQHGAHIRKAHNPESENFPARQTGAAAFAATASVRGDAQGRLDLSRRQGARRVAGGRAAFPGPGHSASGARSARRQDIAGCRQHRPSGADHLPLHRSWPQLEGSGAAARLRQGACGGEGPQRQSHILAHARQGQRARRLVCGHLAPGPVPQRGWRRQLGALLDRQ